MLSDYDKLLVTGRNPIREKQGQVRKPVGRDLIVKMGAKRILVADTGEEFRRSFIETVASEPDIQVLGETGDGQELVQMVKEMAPDLVVMEIVLAQMDGIEVLEELGKLESAQGADPVQFCQGKHGRAGRRQGSGPLYDQALPGEHGV